ncbi:unnamed protein product, partial [marine sediment metagenome]
MLKITEVAGYTIFYDPQIKRFHLEDAEGNVIDSAETQEELEKEAKALSRHDFKRIPIFAVGEQTLSKGEITSFNQHDRSMWINMEGERWGSGRSKVNLYSDGTSGYYLQTKANLKIAEQVVAKGASIQTIRDEIEELEKTLKDPITREYMESREGGK